MIKVGDMVVVVTVGGCAKPACVDDLGLTFVVREMIFDMDGIECLGCGKVLAWPQNLVRHPSSTYGWIPAGWLKKIEPPKTDEATRKEQEVVA